MKTSRFLFATFFLFVSIGTLARAKEPRWVFNHGDDARFAELSQGAFDSCFGLTSIISNGTDCALSFSLKKEDRFSAESRPFFALRYKYETAISTAGVFFTTDKLPTLSDASYSPFTIIPDGSWRNVVVDMRTLGNGNWTGEVRSIRFDPTNPSAPNSRYGVSRLGFFASEEEANAFLSESNDEPDYSQETTLLNRYSRCFIPGDCLDDSFKRADYQLQKPTKLGKIKFNGTREEVALVREDDFGDPKIEALCDVTSQGFVTYCVRDKGPYRLRSFPLKGDEIDFTGRPSESAIRFVLARRLMNSEQGAFRPEDRATDAEIAFIAKRLDEYKSYGRIGAKVAELAKRLNGLTREECATLIMQTIRDALGTNTESGYSRDYYARERIRVGAWCNLSAQFFDERAMAEYAECGFDFILPFIATETLNVMRLGNKYGVEVYATDGAYLHPFVKDAEYCDYPNYTGCYVTDEPGSDAYDKLAVACNPYRALTGKEAYINLLPKYANAAQLKYGANAAAIEYYDSDTELFRKYCASFCDKIDGKYICTDIYPLNRDSQGKKTTYSEYVESINIIASVARDYNREFWCFIQTFSWANGKRTPNESEFRWQCYSMLSFGCKCILCWMYAGSREEFPSLVDVNGEKTRAWHDAKPVMWELRNISDEFVKYRNLGAFTHNCSASTPYLKMTNEYKDFSTIEKIECDKPLLVGCFESKEDAQGKAFTLVNMSELEDAASATVRVRLQGNVATSWRRGKASQVKPDSDGYYTFELESGDGIFVTVK